MCLAILFNTLYKGDTVEKNLNKTSYWLGSAASRGHAKSQLALALMYYHSKIEVIPKDVPAYFWSKLALENGVSAAKSIVVSLEEVMSPFQTNLIYELNVKKCVKFSPDICGEIYLPRNFNIGIDLK